MAVKKVETFRLPSEYERSAAEARRRQRMAEMLAAQAYDPSQVVNAPIPAAAPFVQGLQAFLTARNLKKAEEAEGKAKAADIEEMRNLLTQLGPKQLSGAENVISEMASTAKMGEISPNGTYTMGQITSPTNFKSDWPSTVPAPTGQARQDILMQSAFGGSPRAAELAKLLLTQEKDVEPPYAKINPLDATPESLRKFQESGYKDFTVLRKAEDPAKPLLTPNELARLTLDVANANINRAKILSDLPTDMQFNVPGVPSVENLLRPPPNLQQFTAPTGVPGMPSNRMLSTDLEMGEFSPTRGLQLQRQAQTATGEPIAPQSKPIIEQVSAKDYGALVAKQPVDKKSAQNALGQISMMRNLIQDLQQHGGADYIFGPVASITPDIRGSATSARSLIDTLKERSSVEALKQNRAEGFAPGSITEAEWPRFETAIGAIRGAKDPRAMRVALENANAQLQDLERRIVNNYNETYGAKFPLDWAPPPYKPESSLYPRPEAAAEDKAVFDRADQILMKMKQRGR